MNFNGEKGEDTLVVEGGDGGAERVAVILKNQRRRDICQKLNRVIVILKCTCRREICQRNIRDKRLPREVGLTRKMEKRHRDFL